MRWETYDDINIWIEEQKAKIIDGRVLPPEGSLKRQMDIIVQERTEYQKEYSQIQQAVHDIQNPCLGEIKVPQNRIRRSSIMQKNIIEQVEMEILLQKKKEYSIQLQQNCQKDNELRKTQLVAQYEDFQKYHL